MSAKEMFEKLGYFEKEHTKSYLRYKTLVDCYHGESIDFDLKNKRFRLTNKTSQGNIHFKYGTMEEFKAIQQQIKELGWESDK